MRRNGRDEHYPEMSLRDRLVGNLDVYLAWRAPTLHPSRVSTDRIEHLRTERESTQRSVSARRL